MNRFLLLAFLLGCQEAPPEDPVDVPPVELCPAPRDACTFEVHYLPGTCWVERCIDGELSLVPNDPGTRCVWGAELVEPPWTAGVCDANGICFDVRYPPPND